MVIGVNEFTSTEPPFDTMRVDPALEGQQIARLQAFRAARDNAAASGSISALQRAAQGTVNLLPRIVAAVKARATLGEIANALRDVFGEHGH